MKKTAKRFAVVLCLIMMLSLAGVPAFAAVAEVAEAASPVEYTLKADEAETSLWAYEIGGAAYFKLRDIAMVLDGTEQQFDIDWIPEYREVDLAEGEAYTQAGGELSAPALTGNAAARYTDCSIRCRRNWDNILAYLIDGRHYVKLSDLAAVMGFSSECDPEARTAGIDTSPEAGTAAYTGETIDNIALMDGGNSYFLDDDGVLVVRYADGTEAQVPVTLETAGNETWTGRSAEESGVYIAGEKTGVAYCDARGAVRVLTSEDKGETWETSEVVARSEGVSQMYIGFNTPSDGWLVVCQFHGMGSESHYLYRTSDGGVTWTQIGNTNDLYARMLTGAGFATGNIGFMCYRFETDFSPAVCRTTDGGLSWEKVAVDVPEEFGAYYSETALSPVFSGADGVLPVELKNNGGDTVTIFFTTGDYGDTWTYSPA